MNPSDGVGDLFGGLLDFDIDMGWTLEQTPPRQPRQDQQRKELGEPVSFVPMENTRVCERCILKKVKCDLRRPVCSRCDEDNASCVYSALKRKPGPAKGFKRKASRSVRGNFRDASSRQLDASTDEQSSYILNVPQQQRQREELQQQQQKQQQRHRLPEPQCPEPQDLPRNINEEQKLIETYFARIYPSLRVMPKHKFLQKYYSNQVHSGLLRTIGAITTQLTDSPTTTSTNNKSIIDSLLLDADGIDEYEDGTLAPPDVWQQACLLAFYSFHQMPGRRAATRIDQLARQAYRHGLHRLDDDCLWTLDSSNDLTALGEDDREEWRYIWWAIFNLDSCASVTSGVPAVIDIESINTALLLTSPLTAIDNANRTLRKPGKGKIWPSVQAALAQGGDINPSMHILTLMLLRKAATWHRLWMQIPSAQCHKQLQDIDSDIVAVRLALPVMFHEPTRDVLRNETSSDHCARLVCVCHLQAARILLLLPPQLDENDREVQSRWAQVLDCCEQIVQVVKHWDPRLSLSVDPAVCYIVHAGLMLLHLHYTLIDNTDQQTVERLSMHVNILVLFLEQFGTLWKLPILLVDHYRQFERHGKPSASSGREHEAVGRLLAQFMSSMSPYHYWRKLDKASVQPQIETPLAASSQNDDAFGELLGATMLDLDEFVDHGWAIPGLTTPVSNK